VNWEKSMHKTGLNCVAIWIIQWTLLIPHAWAQISPAFPAAKTGGNYMQNYYLPPPLTIPRPPGLRTVDGSSTQPKTILETSICGFLTFRRVQPAR